MRRFTWIAALVMIGVFASQATAQRMRMSAEERTKMLKDSLSLTAAQADSVLKIYKESDAEREKMFASGQGDRESRMQAMRSMMEKTDAKIEGLLTAEQKTKYEEMVKQRQARMQNMRRGRD